jgi:hypothetical protein
MANKMDKVNGYFGSSPPLMAGTKAGTGTSVYAARSDHVHPNDSSKANVTDVDAVVEGLGETNASLEGLIGNLKGVTFLFPTEVLAADWVEDEGAENPTFNAEVPVPDLDAESVVRLFPVGMTVASFEALNLTVTVGEGALTLTAGAAQADDLSILVLYTRPALFGAPTLPEPDPPPEP